MKWSEWVTYDRYLPGRDYTLYPLYPHKRVSMSLLAYKDWVRTVWRQFGYEGYLNNATIERWFQAWGRVNSSRLDIFEKIAELPLKYMGYNLWSRVTEGAQDAMNAYNKADAAASLALNNEEQDMSYRGRDAVNRKDVPMGYKVARVSFDGFRSNGHLYSYLVPESFDIDATPFVAVYTSSLLEVPDDNPNDRFELQQLKVARVIDVKSIVDDPYEGDYKFIVAAFSVNDYIKRLDAQRQRVKLMAQLKDKADKISQIEALKKVVGDDPEAKALLEQIEAIDRGGV